MRKLAKSIFIFILLSGCSMNRYLINDNGVKDKLLINVVKTLSETNQISKKPLIVINLKPYRFNKELKASRLSFPIESIAEMNLMAREPSIGMFGSLGEGGVILITTKPFQYRENIRPDTVYKVLMSVSVPIDFKTIQDNLK